ncbi:MAG TPA: delta-60 repeat domain-containing protein, partial [Opitutaceae bacterium]
MTFQARPSRISAAGSISRKTFGSARRLAQWFPSSWHGLGRLVAAVALAATTLVPAGATTPTAEDGFAPSANAQVVASAIQPDGKIIVGGYFTEVQAPGQNDPVSVGYLARINPDGTIDTSFNPKANGPVKAIHLLPDGDILIGGYFTSLAPTNGPSFTRNRIARLDSDGRVDPDFDPNLGGVSPSLA